MAQKSILEQALLQVQTLEEAVKANAKGILASTMKQELNDLLKEQEDEKLPDEEEKDVEGENPEDSETSISNENPSDEEAPEDAEEPGDELPAEPEGEIPPMDELGGEESPEDSEEDFLDMTDASEEEVLKVFKAMKPEDGIVVKKEGDTVQFSDDGNDYIIKLDDEGEEAPEGMGAPEGLEGEEPEGLEGEEPDELAEQKEPADEEIVYEIELNDEEECDECGKKMEAQEGKNSPFDKNVKGERKEIKENVPLPTKAPNKSGPFKGKAEAQVGKGVKKLQANEQETGVDKWSGTPLKGTANPETKEPGRGQVKTSDGRPGSGVKGTDTPKKFDDLGKGKDKTSSGDWDGTAVKGTSKPIKKEPKEEVECAECGQKMETDEAARTKWNIHGDKGGQNRAGIKSKKLFKAGSKHEGVELNEEVETLKKQNAEYRKALVLFKEKLNEVAVFNANLAYATRLFTEHSTTKQEKLDILKRFDSISTINESKTLFATIKGELDNKKPISESAVEKIASTPTSSSTEVLSESKAYENPQFRRMKELMQKIK